MLTKGLEGLAFGLLWGGGNAYARAAILVFAGHRGKDHPAGDGHGFYSAGFVR